MALQPQAGRVQVFADSRDGRRAAGQSWSSSVYRACRKICRKVAMTVCEQASPTPCLFVDIRVVVPPSEDREQARQPRSSIKQRGDKDEDVESMMRGKVCFVRLVPDILPGQSMELPEHRC